MQMKSLYYLDAPRVLSLALFPHTSIDDGLFPNVPNDDDAPTCYYCDDALHLRPQVCTREGRLDSSAAHVCYDCARAEFGAHCRGCQDFTKYPH
tara:strand:- start:535 stop:816 length:282 start_codon:yes stop_codon:yes gene_type:complete